MGCPISASNYFELFRQRWQSKVEKTLLEKPQFLPMHWHTTNRNSQSCFYLPFLILRASPISICLGRFAMTFFTWFCESATPLEIDKDWDDGLFCGDKPISRRPTWVRLKMGCTSIQYSVYPKSSDFKTKLWWSTPPQVRPSNAQLHSTTLYYTKLHYTTLHYTTVHYIPLHSTTLHYITLHYITLNDTAPQIDRSTDRQTDRQDRTGQDRTGQDRTRQEKDKTRQDR